MTKAIAAFAVAEDDYAEFLSIVEDRSNMPDTHAQFVANLDRKLGKLKAQGVSAVKIVVPMKTFREMIAAGHVKADSNGRAKVAAILAMRRLSH